MFHFMCSQGESERAEYLQLQYLDVLQSQKIVLQVCFCKNMYDMALTNERGG
jgi:hypothetical protein